MRIFKTKWMARFVRKEALADASLVEAMERVRQGLVDADLGGGLIKQRIARKGKGRSGGYRMIVAYRDGDRAIFLYGFAKNERENIGADELASWREVGQRWLTVDARTLAAALKEEALVEVDHGKEDKEPHA